MILVSTSADAFAWFDDLVLNVNLFFVEKPFVTGDRLRLGDSRALRRRPALEPARRARYVDVSSAQLCRRFFKRRRSRANPLHSLMRNSDK